MKKILFLLLSVGILANEAEMQATATVLESLTIRIDQQVDFGNVARGSSNNKGIGQFSVRGEQSENVNIQFEGLENNELILTNISGTKMTARFEGITDNKINLPNATFNKFEDLVFLLDVPEDINRGVYQGTFKIKARYE